MGQLRAHKAIYLEEWKSGSEYLPFFRSSILPFLALTAQKIRAYAFLYNNYVLRTAGGVLNPASKGVCVSPKDVKPRPLGWVYHRVRAQCGPHLVTQGAHYNQHRGIDRVSLTNLLDVPAFQQAPCRADRKHR